MRASQVKVNTWADGQTIRPAQYVSRLYPCRPLIGRVGPLQRLLPPSYLICQCGLVCILLHWLLRALWQSPSVFACLPQTQSHLCGRARCPLCVFSWGNQDGVALCLALIADILFSNVSQRTLAVMPLYSFVLRYGGNVYFMSTRLLQTGLYFKSTLVETLSSVYSHSH